MAEEITNPPVDPVEDSQVDPGLAAIIGEVLDARDARQREAVKSTLAALAKPDRTIAERIDPTPSGDASEPGPIVSRNQPTDPLYSRLHRDQPNLSDYRNADLDHWNAEFLRGMVTRDRSRQQVARDKAHAIVGERAVTSYLEGALDASDPTAILDGTAGSLLPQPLAAVISIARDNASVLPGVVQNLTLTSGTLRVPTASAFTTEMVAEGSTSDEAGPTFASVMLKAQKAQAFAKISIEALADAAFNMVSLLAQRAGTSIGALEDTQICTSNGTAPNISAAISGGNVDEAVSGTLSYADIVTLYFALGKTYRTNAVWLGDGTTLTLLSKLLDGNNLPILRFPNQQVNAITDVPGAIGSLYNKPVYEVPLASGTLIFGDPTGYVFARRQGITAATSEHADFASDLVQFKFTERIDGNMVDSVALKQMSGLTTV